MIDETLDKCKNNMNIVEQFYADNRELYEEVSQKVLSLYNIIKMYFSRLKVICFLGL